MDETGLRAEAVAAYEDWKDEQEKRKAKSLQDNWKAATRSFKQYFGRDVEITDHFVEVDGITFLWTASAMGISWFVMGTCKCGAWVRSSYVASLVDVGKQIAGFQPDNMEHACHIMDKDEPDSETERPAEEVLVQALRALIEEVAVYRL